MNLRLASLFQDHAVLQRDAILPVWGWSQPKESLVLQLGPTQIEATADAVGFFKVNFPPMPAGGPYSLEVFAEQSKESIVVRDLLIGEVWLCSGQSNMEFTLAQCEPVMSEDIVSANYPDIRNFKVTHDRQRLYLGEQPVCEGVWQRATPDQARSFSAVAYTFARRLHRELNVPVGIIDSSWGGTRIESWTSQRGLMQIPQLREDLNRYEIDVYSGNIDKRREDMEQQRNDRFPRDPGNIGVQQGWHKPDFQYAEWSTMRIPSLWQTHGMTFSGIFWFRKRISLPQHWIGKTITLHVGSIDKQDISYANGEEIGRMGKDRELDHWDKPRRYTIPAHLTKSETLDLAIRVYSFMAGGGVTGADDEFYLQLSDNETIPLAGDWHYAIEHNFGVVDHEIPIVMGPGEQNSLHMLFDNMIAPLIPYAIRGAIWYQGESNANRAGLYFEQMKQMILDWRYHWGQGSFPFIITQLTGYYKEEDHNEESTWAHIREAQLMSALELSDVGLAVTTDVGDSLDIHPRNKAPIGYRLAQYALHHSYGYSDIVAGCPLPTRFEIQQNEIHCYFKNAGKGLTTSDKQAVRTVVIAGEDRRFVPAAVRYNNDCLIVSHPDIRSPKHVRYGWSYNPQSANLCSSEGFPASPFRFDAE
jgi:sialate O-acetylesterase